MAKSIRSKRGRKLRAFKRIRYGEKELTRLKKMLDKAAEEEKQNSIITDNTNTDVEGDGKMETDSQSNKCDSSSKPSKYPSWLSQFKIKKLAKQERKRKRKETKRLKKEKKAEFKKGKGKTKKKSK